MNEQENGSPDLFEYGILDAVQENDGNLTQRHISQKLGRSVASVNFALRLLAVKGYIKITGANRRNLRYHLTPKGILQKSILAYNFVKCQSALYEEVRKDLLGKLQDLFKDGVRRVALYGWTPFTEVAMLYLLSEGIEIAALYMDSISEALPCNRIIPQPIQEFQDDCDILVLMEPMPAGCEETITKRKLICFHHPSVPQNDKPH